MKYIKMIKYDISWGIIKRFLVYLVVILIFLISCIKFNQEFDNAEKYGMIQTKAGFMDYLIYTFQGAKKYNIAIGQQVRIPVIWLSIQLYVGYLVCYYPADNLSSFGQYILIYSKSRRGWWISKCIWNMSSVLLFYILGYGTILIYTIIQGGNISLNSDNVINAVINNINLETISRKELVLATILLPILTSISVSIVEMLVSLILSPIISFVIVVAMLIASFYYLSPLLLGNYSMVVRNSILLEGGINTQKGIIINIMLGFLCIIIGLIYFKRYDVLEKDSV